MQERQEVAPPLETSWADHLKDLDNSQLSELAKDYSWLECEARPQEARGELHKRREAIVAECERRGMREAAAGCRPR